MYESVEDLNEQEIQVIKLILSRGIIHYSDVSKSIGRSRKTIAKYLDNIGLVVQHYQMQLVRKRNVGIYLEGDATNLQSTIQHRHYPSLPHSRSERVITILSKLLLTNRAVTIQNLADSTFVSRSTLENDFKEVKHILAKHHAIIETTHAGMKVIASESAKRKLMSELLTMYWGNTMYLENKAGKVERKLNIPKDIQPFFDRDTFQKVLNALDQFERISPLHFTDYEYQSLAIHLIISMTRITKDQTLENKVHPVKLEVNTINLVHILEENFKLPIPEYERQYINIHILAAQGQPLGHDSLEKAAAPLQKTVIHDFLAANIRDHDETLLRGLTVHLMSALKRLYLGLNLHNPYVDDIKKFFPLAFNNAIDISAKTEKKFNITLNEDEVAFIALHIEAYLERQKHMINVMIVCSTGLGTARLLEQRVKKFFASSIHVNRVTSIQSLKDHPITEDLVISTIKIEIHGVPVIVVPPFLDKGAVQQIHQVSEQILLERQNRNSFAQLLSPDLIMFSNHREERADVIKNIGQKLVRLGYGKVGIGQAAITREKLASTAISQVAMPHAPIEFVLKPCIAIYINQQGIEWNGNQVHIVFFLAMNQQVQTQIEAIYQRFNAILESEKLLKELIRCHNAAEVIEKLGGETIG